MKLRSVRICFKQGFIGIHRNRWMVVASVLTVSACLFILGIVSAIVLNARNIAGDMDDQLGIVAFLSENVKEEAVPTLLEQVRGMEGVKQVEYISAEQAWDDFKEAMGFEEQLGGDLVSELDRDNPLAGSASFQIYVYDAAGQKAFVEQLSTMPQFRNIRYSEETADVLSDVSRVFTVGGAVLILLLVFISVLLISNTIKLSVFVRRNEIEIMKYIGAMDSFVKIPFVVEGVMIGLMGAVLPALIIYFSYDALIRIIREQFNTTFSQMIRFLDTGTLMTYLVPLFLGVGIIVGVLGSLFSLRKHLNV